MSKRISVILFLSLFPVACLANDLSWAFGPATLSLGLPKEKVVDLCPLLKTIDEVNSHAKASHPGQSCSLLPLGSTGDEYIIYAGDQFSTELRGRVRFTANRISMIGREWSELRQPSPEVYAFFETLVELVSDAAGQEETVAKIQVVRRKSPDFRGGSLTIQVANRAVSLIYDSRSSSPPSVVLEEILFQP